VCSSSDNSTHGSPLAAKAVRLGGEQFCMASDYLLDPSTVQNEIWALVNDRNVSVDSCMASRQTSAGLVLKQNDSRRFSMRRNRFLVGFAVLCVSLFVTTKAPAKEPNFDGVQNRKGISVVFMNRQELLRTAKSLGLTVRRLKLSTSEKARLANLRLKGCGCASTLVQDLGESCFPDCLKSNGVNPISAASCGAVCSVNLVGCAICAGVGEWVVLGCAQYCVWRRPCTRPGGIL